MEETSLRSDDAPKQPQRGQRNRTTAPAPVEVDHAPDRALRPENSLTLKNGIRLHLQAYGEVYMEAVVTRPYEMFSNAERLELIRFLSKRV